MEWVCNPYFRSLTRNTAPSVILPCVRAIWLYFCIPCYSTGGSRHSRLRFSRCTPSVVTGAWFTEYLIKLKALNCYLSQVWTSFSLKLGISLRKWRAFRSSMNTINSLAVLISSLCEIKSAELLSGWDLMFSSLWLSELNTRRYIKVPRNSRCISGIVFIISWSLNIALILHLKQKVEKASKTLRIVLPMNRSSCA